MCRPFPGFLETLREQCDQSGALLIIDEVMTGFRLGLQGAQGRYGVTADLTTLGKVIGGGMPVGAFGGKREVMEHIAPLGPVYQAGTLSGNPVAMAAGLAQLEKISQPGFYEPLFAKTETLVQGLRERAAKAGIPFTTNHVGTMFGAFFTDVEPVVNYQQAINCNQDHFNPFFHGMLEEGVYLAPASYEAGFMSAAHSNDDIQENSRRRRAGNGTTLSHPWQRQTQKRPVLPGLFIASNPGRLQTAPLGRLICQFRLRPDAI